MQLNPARGRKLFSYSVRAHMTRTGLCSSTPRGDGNIPRDTIEFLFPIIAVYAAQPREGTETVELRVVYMYRGHLGLCSSTPRGDGNTTDSNREIPRVSPVYAAQPREGTETRRFCSYKIAHTYRFMQLNPARGRKRSTGIVIGKIGIRFMQLNPARGRKQSRKTTINNLNNLCGLCSSTPRGDGNMIPHHNR